MPCAFSRVGLSSFISWASVSRNTISINLRYLLDCGTSPDCNLGFSLPKQAQFVRLLWCNPYEHKLSFHFLFLFFCIRFSTTIPMDNKIDN